MAKTGAASKLFVWILLGMLIVGLAGFGIGNFGGSAQSVGAVGDEEVTVEEYARGLQNQLREFQAQTGQSIPMSEARALGLDRVVLEQLMATAALDNETARIGLSVGDEEVRRRLFGVPAFQGIDGKFDRTAYDFALEQAGIGPAEFDEELRDEAARFLLRDAVAAGVAADPVFAETLLAYIGETRSLRWAALGEEHLAEPVPVPSEAEIEAYYTENPDAFTAPEIRRITYVWLTPDLLVDRIEVDEAALRALYDERAEEFNRPEQRLVERLVFASAEEAAAAYAGINAGETDFDALVAERGLALEDVDLGEVTRDDLSAEAAAMVFGMIGPGVTEPVTSSLGPALFRVNAILGAQSVEFEAVRDDLKAEFAADRARRMIGDGMERIDDLLAGGATLEEVAAETDMELGQIDFSAESEHGIAGYDAFRDAANLAQADDFPEIVELSDGGIFALRLDEVVPPTLRPLDEVRNDVLSAWRATEIRRRLGERAAALKAELDAGATMEALGLAPNDAEGLSRDAYIDGTPRTMVEEAFALADGETAVVTGAAGVFLLRLTGLSPADPEDPEMQALAETLATRQTADMAEDIFTLYSGAVLNTAGIEINQAAINAVHAQFP